MSLCVYFHQNWVTERRVRHSICRGGLAAGETVVAALVKKILNQADECGMPNTTLADYAGLSSVERLPPDARVSLSNQMALWRLITELGRDSAFGIRVGASLRPREMGLVGYGMYYSGTLLEALEWLVRYSRILTGAGELILRKWEPHHIAVAEHPRNIGITMQHPVDMRLAGIVAVAREITETPIRPVVAEFPYAQPSSVLEHKRFFNCPLRFSQPSSSLTFRYSDAYLPVASGNRAVVTFLEKLAKSILHTLTGVTSLAERLRATAWADIGGGKRSLQQIAETIGTTTRTLQRSLQREGTSVRAVLDGVRKYMALAFLGDQRLSIQDVALMVGYSDASSFHRAFKRWMGSTPSEYRSTLRY